MGQTEIDMRPNPQDSKEEPAPKIKAKRTLTEEQKENLRKGREKRSAMLKAKKAEPQGPQGEAKTPKESQGEETLEQQDPLGEAEPKLETPQGAIDLDALSHKVVESLWSKIDAEAPPTLEEPEPKPKKPRKPRTPKPSPEPEVKVAPEPPSVAIPSRIVFL